METSEPESSSQPNRMGCLSKGLVLGALGVVYGDIGTSPLYAFRECFNDEHGVSVSPENVLGVLSLIFWSLMFVVVLKYITVVMRADNAGEGGILALMARVLAGRANGKTKLPQATATIVMLGLCGTSLLVADGMITPAISVLSAVEGLQVATAVSRAAIMAITVVIFIGLFYVQRFGTGRIGALFSPVMVLWFVSIAILGGIGIVQKPFVLWALNPWHAVRFFMLHGGRGLMVFGAVVLCVTGCEALYADMGHFGRRPISMAWYLFVFPAVVLNYFGQGAVVLTGKPGLVGADSLAAALLNPFFALVPNWLVYPMVGLATAATIIASQALISGMFSMVQQAIQLNYLPRLNIVHTSETMHGQIFIPQINGLLGTACVALVFWFRDSSSLAAAYGIAVIGTMATTSMLMFFVEYEQWGWKLWQAALLTGGFLIVDGAFLAGNLAKIVHGGWFPLVAGVGVLAVLTTWKRGSDTIERINLTNAIPLDEFVNDQLTHSSVHRVRGTAVFLMSNPTATPRLLLHHLKHNKVLHEHVIFMPVVYENVPFVEYSKRLTVEGLRDGFTKVTVSCGFMENIDMRDVVRRCQEVGVNIGGEISYYIGRMTLRVAGRMKLPVWRKMLFAYLFRNERSSMDFLGIRPNRVVELGEQVEI